MDQLFLIQKVIGNMTRKQMEKFLRNPKFIGVKMPDLHGRVEGLERRLPKLRDKKLFTLLNNMLVMEPSERWTATQCLQAEWFDSVRKQCLNHENSLWREMGIDPRKSMQDTRVEQPKPKKTPSRTSRSSQSPRQFHEHIVSIGIPAKDLPNLPPSRNSRSRERGSIMQQNSFNFGFRPAGLPSLAGLPGIPRYQKGGPQ